MNPGVTVMGYGGGHGRLGKQEEGRYIQHISSYLYSAPILWSVTLDAFVGAKHSGWRRKSVTFWVGGDAAGVTNVKLSSRLLSKSVTSVNHLARVAHFPICQS